MTEYRPLSDHANADVQITMWGNLSHGGGAVFQVSNVEELPICAKDIAHLARGYLLWPGLDQDIQNFVSQCTPCEFGRNQSPSTPLHPWSWTKTPWERIHIDYAEIDKQHFLVIVDVQSKWVEIFCTQLTNAEKTVNLLCHLWASYGFPKVLVSDNGPPLISKEFE